MELITKHKISFLVVSLNKRLNEIPQEGNHKEGIPFVKGTMRQQFEIEENNDGSFDISKTLEGFKKFLELSNDLFKRQTNDLPR